MAKKLFNEAEKFVIQTYPDVKLLEESLEKVRDKYRGELQRIGAEVKEQFPQLDYFDDQFRASWATGYLVFSRRAWAGDPNYPSGLHFDYLRLDQLTSRKGEEPCGYVWTKPSRKAGVDVAALRTKLWAELPKVLTPEELAKCEDEKDDDLPVSWPLATKLEVIHWLLNDQIEVLSERILEQTGVFAKMLPVLDEFLTKGRTAKNK